MRERYTHMYVNQIMINGKVILHAKITYLLPCRLQSCVIVVIHVSISHLEEVLSRRTLGFQVVCPSITL